MRLGGAVVFLQRCDGGFELVLDGRALATGQAAAQLSPQFLDVVLKRDHRPLLLFRRRGGRNAPTGARAKTANAPPGGARGRRFWPAPHHTSARLRAPYAA